MAESSGSLVSNNVNILQKQSCVVQHISPNEIKTETESNHKPPADIFATPEATCSGTTGKIIDLNKNNSQDAESSE